MNFTIGKRILQLRREHNLSQQALSKKLGVSRQTIGKWEQDLNLPDLEMLMALSDIFEVSLSSLLGMEEKVEEITEDSISDFYIQIQEVLLNLQKENKQKTLFQKISIGICILCLLMMLSLKIQLDKQTTTLHVLFETSQNSNTTQNASLEIDDLNKPIIDNSYLATANMNVQTIYNLSKGKVRVHYHFTLKEYTKETKVALQFIDEEGDVSTYEMERDEHNVFVFNKEIPLRNYPSLLVNITENNQTKTENLVKTNQCNYLNYAIMKHIHLFIPLKSNGKLDLKTITYQPILNTENNISFIGQLSGEMIMYVYQNPDEPYHNEIHFNLEQAQSTPFPIKDILNTPLYSYLKLNVSINDEENPYFYHVNLGTMQNKGKEEYSYFIVTDKTKEYTIY